MRSGNGRVAIVTGGSRGIGAAISKRLARDGIIVVVGYRERADAAAEVVLDIERHGGEAEAIQVDMADPKQVKQFFSLAFEAFDRLDILVNNAGVAEFLPLAHVTLDHFDRQFAVNVRGALVATQEAAKRIGPTGGRIINISSGAATSAPPGTSVYSATKAALDAMTRVHAQELGARGITVNAVSPGITETDMLAEVIPPEAVLQLVENTALKRLGTPEDIAEVVAFLASEEGRWVTGQVIGANGGLR